MFIVFYTSDYSQMTMVYKMQQNQAPKSDFKAKVLEFLRQVETSGHTLIVTDHGKPSIEVRRYRPADRSPLEILKGSVTEYLDPTEPVGKEDWKTRA